MDPEPDVAIVWTGEVERSPGCAFDVRAELVQVAEDGPGVARRSRASTGSCGRESNAPSQRPRLRTGRSAFPGEWNARRASGGLDWRHDLGGAGDGLPAASRRRR